MQKSFINWVESVLKNDTNSTNYKNNFIELCKYGCNTDSLFILYEDIENLEKVVVRYSENIEEVIKYVKEHPNAIGVIGVNWISDEDDPKVLDFLDGK